jgi:hypothetical protein
LLYSKSDRRSLRYFFFCLSSWMYSLTKAKANPMTAPTITPINVQVSDETTLNQLLVCSIKEKAFGEGFLRVDSLYVTL